ncbi:MAG: type II toxin-antitoxin system VapC family toxin [Acidimicrobiales bacterium]
MALVYFDASALVKLVVEEDGSNLASQLWDGCDAALSSRLAYPEVCAALAAAGRNRQLTRTEAQAALAIWEEFWPAMRPVELTATVARHAGQLARTRSLRGADAVHLASVAALGGADVVFAVWDRRLHAGALAEGIAVAPSTLG